jgi:hypothetical protein
MDKAEWLARAHYHLQGWADYRRSVQGATSKGYPSRSAFLATGGASAAFDDMVDEADFAAARTCDAIIGEIKDIYRQALESWYLMQGVIKHNRRSESELLHEAQLAFWDKARKWLV